MSCPQFFSLKINWSEEFKSTFLVPLVCKVIILFAEFYQVVSEYWRQVLAGLTFILFLWSIIVHLHVISKVCLLTKSPVAYPTLEGP